VTPINRYEKVCSLGYLCTETVTSRVGMCTCAVRTVQELFNTYQFYRTVNKNRDVFGPMCIYVFYFSIVIQQILKIIKGDIGSPLFLVFLLLRYTTYVIHCIGSIGTRLSLVVYRHSSRGESARSTSVKSKMQGDQRGGRGSR
jgi:hypothetical protein